MECKQRQVREARGGAKRRGFSLIELMVVIGIIVLLMAILLPALSGVRTRGYVTSTTALMAGLQANIAQYQQDFGALPGPISEKVMGASGGGKQLCGAQNMYVGLSRKWQTATFTNSTTISVTGATTIYVDNTGTASPQDNSTNPVRMFKSYFNPKPDESADMSVYNTGLSCRAFPMIVDKFPDALPILYYRATPGMEKSSNGFVAEDNSGTVAPFYLSSNVEVTGNDTTSVSLYSTKGVKFTQHLKIADFRKMVGTGDGTANSGVPGGGFVLISAGIDRTYGPNSSNKTDDNIIFGGS